MSENPVIEAQELTKRYGSLLAVDRISFSVQPGEIFGLIGPNGAGKTTTMECIEGIRKPDSGAVRVLGLDPYRETAALQQRIGVQLQQAELQKRIKVWEAVDLMASLYPHPADRNALLEQLGLSSKLNARFMTLSGGQKQRLFIALALINDPDVVFLDELTTGLDPQARRVIWTLIEDIRARGKTVFMTTHSMEEAERLCDRVTIVEQGRVIAMDTPARLIETHCPEIGVSFRCDRNVDINDLRQGIEGIDFAENGDAVELRGRGPDFVSEVIRWLSEHELRVKDLHTRRSTLEDVFLKLTGHGIRE